MIFDFDFDLGFIGGFFLVMKLKLFMKFRLRLRLEVIKVFGFNDQGLDVYNVSFGQICFDNVCFIIQV